MPELPDLVYIEKKLEQFLPGKKIEQVIIKNPIVLRIMAEGTFESALRGKKILSINRKGPFLNIHLDGLELVIHFMLTGKLQYRENDKAKIKMIRDICFTIHFDDRSLLHYGDQKSMGKVYLIEPGEYQAIPGYETQGVDILDSAFTLAVFKNLIKKKRSQVRGFIMDQTELSAIGNAYADEILFDAQIHPKTPCNKLSSEEIEGLYESIHSVIMWGIDEVERADEQIETKVRGHVKVRNRKDQPCPVCGNKIRRCSLHGYDAFFCPVCQPAKGRQTIQW